MMCLRSDIDVACSITIKLSTYNSISHRVQYIIGDFCGRIMHNVANVCFSGLEI